MTGDRLTAVLMILMEKLGKWVQGEGNMSSVLEGFCFRK